MNILMVTNQYPTQDKPDTNPAVFYQTEGLKALGVKIDVLHIDRSSKGVFAYLINLIPLKRIWQTKNFDLMHIQFGGVQALIGVLLAKKQTVVTYHGSDLHGGNHSRWLWLLSQT